MQLAVWVGNDLLTSLDAAFDFKVFVDPLTANGNCFGLTVFNDVDLPIFNAGLWNPQLVLRNRSLDRLPIHKVFAA